jgi:hypothetical protein
MSYSNKFKQGFIDRVEKKLRDCEIIYNPKTKGIWFINREERYWYLEYKIETNYLWWRYEFFNQLKELFCMSNEVFDEIISGMSFDRKDFNEMLNSIIKGKVECVIIENKDRLARFGFDLLEQLFKLYGTKIIIANDEISNKTYEQELTDDLISIIHYFSMKSYSNRRKLNKFKKELIDND